MSKFIEKIKRASSKVTIPLGFKKPSAEEEIPQILLIASQPGTTQKQIKELIDSGIDAFIFNIPVGEEINRLQKSLKDTPFGIVIRNSANADVDKFMEDGCDFAVFDINTGIQMIDKDGLGKVLVSDRNLTPVMIKSINDLNTGIDCVLIDDDKKIIDIDLLLVCHLYKDLLNKPLLVNIAGALTETELVELKNAGVKGLIISSKVSASVIKDLSVSIKNLPRTDRRKTANSPIIPSLRVEQTSEQEDTEPDEEDI